MPTISTLLARKSLERTHRTGGLLLAAALAMLVTAAYGGDSGTERPALRTIDRAALQQLVETRARDMLVPGAVVILRTPRGGFTSTYGVTR